MKMKLKRIGNSYGLTFLQANPLIEKPELQN